MFIYRKIFISIQFSQNKERNLSTEIHACPNLITLKKENPPFKLFFTMNNIKNNIFFLAILNQVSKKQHLTMHHYIWLWYIYLNITFIPHPPPSFIDLGRTSSSLNAWISWSPSTFRSLSNKVKIWYYQNIKRSFCLIIACSSYPFSYLKKKVILNILNTMI